MQVMFYRKSGMPATCSGFDALFPLAACGYFSFVVMPAMAVWES
jgi:hypothetical protein